MSTISKTLAKGNLIAAIRGALASRGRTDEEAATPLAESLSAALAELDDRTSERIMRAALDAYDAGRDDGYAIGYEEMRGRTEELEAA